MLALGATALGALGATVAGCSKSGSGQGDTSKASADVELITLGTLGAPPPVKGRKGISSALVVHGRTYIVDCGRSSVTQFVDAGLGFDSIAAMFITHLHADHVADFYNYFMLGGCLLGNLEVPPRVTPVYGPGSAGGLPPTALGENAPTAGPDPTPGLRKLTEDCNAAYAYSDNILMRTGLIQNIEQQMDIREIALPDVGASFTNTAPTMKPFPVMEDDYVKVSAVLVPHYDTFPSFAYRFDLDNGKSITFSGDTTVTPNIPEIAHGTDLLVHESCWPLSAEELSAMLPGKAVRFNPDYLAKSHTFPADVGKAATAAGAKQVVLSHIDPATIPDAKWREAVGKNYSGPITVAADLQHFPLN